jgi:hypothetical protein
MLFSSELIKKYSTKCKENENLQKQLKQLSALLKEYQSKLINTVTKQMPLEEVRSVCAISTVIEWTKLSTPRYLVILFPCFFSVT